MALTRILILGAGFGGLEVATRLAERLDDRYEITLVDERDAFFVGFSKIDVLFGRKSPREVSYPYETLRAERVRFVRETILQIDTDERTVRTSGRVLPYDYLVVALGADLDPSATPGFVESGGHEFYSMAGAEALAPVLRAFSSGTLVLGILRLPYKCPPAPYEVACQLHAYFDERRVRDSITLKMIIPGPRPVPSPAVSDALEAELAARDIELIADAPIEVIDPSARQVRTRKGAFGYDLFVGVPVHVPPKVVAESTLSDDGGFIAVDRHTLETRISNVYAVGDVTKIPVGDKAVPKAGAFAEDAARTVASDILRKEGLVERTLPFEARGACFVELGPGAVARIDADFLGGESPKMGFSGPSEALLRDKERFASERRERWFTPAAQTRVRYSDSSE